MGNYFRNEDAEPQINKIIAADRALFTAITFPWLLSFPPLICSTSLNQWPDEELSVHVKQKAPKADSGFPISKSCLGLSGAGSWLAPWINSTWNWEAGKGQSKPDEFCRVSSHLPGRTFCCDSLAEVTAKGLETSLSASRCPAVSGKGSRGLPYLPNPAQTGINSVWKTLSTVCIAKPAFQVVQMNQTQVETGLTPACYPVCTSHHSAFRPSDLRQGGKPRIINLPWNQAWNPTDTNSLWKTVAQFSLT